MIEPPPWENLLPVQTVLALHAEGIRLHGGDLGDPKQGCVEQSLGNAYTAEQYSQTDDSEGGLCFAGYVLFYLASNHCFTDGNKRIAWSSAMRILLISGLTVEATDEEAVEFCLRIADSTREDKITDGIEVVEWLAERLFPVA